MTLSLLLQAESALIGSMIQAGDRRHGSPTYKKHLRDTTAKVERSTKSQNCSGESGGGLRTKKRLTRGYKL